MKKINSIISLTEYNSLTELCNEDQMLLKEAAVARDKAYAPYSKFSVGASVLLENGQIVRGNNQENAAYPSGLCAERIAVFAAMAEHPGVKINAIAITAKSEVFKVNAPIYPCGACRQVIAEYETMGNSKIRLILQGVSGKIHIFESAISLLPSAFTTNNLTNNIIH